jgi:hypothetical protein
MKTTKELIIADITAKVEAKLASQKVELGYLQSVQKDAEANQKKYSDVFELIKYHDEANRWIFKNVPLVENFNTTRKIYLDKMTYEHDRLSKELKFIKDKLDSVGINPQQSVEYKTAFSANAQLLQYLLNLERNTKEILFKR